jgi:YesN/AraC family two-component response regulator
MTTIPLYTYYQLICIKEKKMEAEAVSKKNGLENTKLRSNEIEKYNLLYSEIVKYFEEKKLHLDPHLTISKLAIMLNTNINYIYQAIQINNNVSFNTFVNSHRINTVKKMIEEGWSEKYTIQHIYTSAGFLHQTTFNKVFKSFEHMSPSDYIAKHREKLQ